MRPALWIAWAFIVLVLGAAAVWGWIAFVPDFVQNPEIPYMERVLSPILYTFLLLLMGAGSAVLTAAGFVSWERRRRARLNQATGAGG